MENLGVYLVFFGGGGLLLNKWGIDFFITSWMPTWGKVLMLVVGIILFFVGPRPHPNDDV